jgi:hypothetical protein
MFPHRHIHEFSWTSHNEHSQINWSYLDR